MKSKVFVGSSVEGLNVAYSIQQNLIHDAETTVWDQGVFELSKTTIESLDDILDSADFGVFVFSPDDVIMMRGKESQSIRDNVLFELGLFIGKLGRERVFFIVPDGEDIHIPTDLIGITPGKYDPNREDKSLQAATGPVCHQIRTQIKKIGLIDPDETSKATDKKEDKIKSSEYEWIHDFFNNEFEKAKTKLEAIKINKSGDELLDDEAWIAYCNFKIDEKNGLQDFLNLVNSHKDSLNIQKIVTRMLLWEDYTDKAIEIINNAIKIHDNDNALMVLLAECLKKNNDFSGAKQLLESNLPYKNPEIALALAELYEENQDLEAAISALNGVYSNYPSNESICYKYSRLLIDTERNKEALYLLHSLTVNYPEKVTYWGYLSNCCLTLDLYDNAMVACKKAEELSQGKEGWIIHNIGNLFNSKGFYTEAITYLKKGLEIESSSQYAHGRLASSLKNKDEEQDKLHKLCKEGRVLIRKFGCNSEQET